MNRAVILDRDGVINKDRGYLYQPEEFCFLDGIFSFCHTAQSKGYLLIVATNQSGIARGYYTEEDFFRLNDWMCSRFEEHGVTIHRIYHCPFHPIEGIGKYRVDSFDRKPKPGMILKARDEFELDLKRCILIGDRDNDMEAGRRAGVGTLLLLPDQYEFSAAGDIHLIHTLQDAEQFL